MSKYPVDKDGARTTFRWDSGRETVEVDGGPGLPAGSVGGLIADLRKRLAEERDLREVAHRSLREFQRAFAVLDNKHRLSREEVADLRAELAEMSRELERVRGERDGAPAVEWCRDCGLNDCRHVARAEDIKAGGRRALDAIDTPRDSDPPDDVAKVVKGRD